MNMMVASTAAVAHATNATASDVNPHGCNCYWAKKGRNCMSVLDDNTICWAVCCLHGTVNGTMLSLRDVTSRFKMSPEVLLHEADARQQDPQHRFTHRHTKKSQDSAIEVVASTRHGTFYSIDDHRLTVYRHDNSSMADAASHYAADGTFTREAGVFLEHVITRYDSLANLTAFVHWDAWLHNPVWPRWLQCLKLDAQQASLSPLLISPPPHAETTPLAQALSIKHHRHLPAACCFHMVYSRRALRRLPKAAYEEALSILLAHNGTPFHLENVAHFLAPPTGKSWLDPQVNFNTNNSYCDKSVQYLPSFYPYPLVSGIPIVPYAPRRFLEWQEQVCGVANISAPDSRELRSVQETVTTPCLSAMRSLGDMVNASGCKALSDRQASQSYAQYVTNLTNPGMLHGSQRPMAKAAIFMVKPAMCRGLVRCWQRCCSECARHSWCKAWAWRVAEEACDLSAEPSRLARAATFDVVVGSNLQAT